MTASPPEPDSTSGSWRLAHSALGRVLFRQGTRLIVVADVPAMVIGAASLLRPTPAARTG
jgi:hypothetical protein